MLGAGRQLRLRHQRNKKGNNQKLIFANIYLYVCARKLLANKLSIRKWLRLLQTFLDFFFIDFYRFLLIEQRLHASKLRNNNIPY